MSIPQGLPEIFARKCAINCGHVLCSAVTFFNSVGIIVLLEEVLNSLQLNQLAAPIKKKKKKHSSVSLIIFKKQLKIAPSSKGCCGWERLKHEKYNTWHTGNICKYHYYLHFLKAAWMGLLVRLCSLSKIS